MLKLLPVPDIGSAGLNSDLSPNTLPAGNITRGTNFRVKDGKIVTAGSLEAWTTPPVDFNAGHLLFAQGLSDDFWIVAGRTAVYMYDGLSWFDITTATYSIGVDGELNWTSCMLGSIPIINNPQYFPEYWSPQTSGTNLTLLEFSAGVTFTAAGISCEVIRSHKNFVFLLNLTESTVNLPSSYRWSHPADNNGLPPSFDETDLNYIAGKSQLGGDSGKIVDGLTLRDSFCIYSERGVNVLDYTGDEFIWRARPLSTKIGLINRNSIAEVKGNHYFIGDGDIYFNDGLNIVSAIHKRIRTRFNESASSTYYNRSYCVNNVAAKEIWFCIPEGQSVYPNTAFVYNWNDDTWAVRDIPESTAFASYGTKSVPNKTWANIGGQWNTTTATWGSQEATPLNQSVVSVSADDSSLSILDAKGSNLPATLSSVIERTDYPIDGIISMNTVVAVYPQMSGSHDVKIEIGSQMWNGGTIKWEPAVMFNPSTDRKVDVISTGALHCWRITNTPGTSFTLNGMDFEYSFSGAA